MNYIVYINFSSCDEIWCNLDMISPHEALLIVKKREKDGGMLSPQSLFSIQGLRLDVIEYYLHTHQISFEIPIYEQWLTGDSVQHFIFMKMQELGACVGQLQQDILHGPGSQSQQLKCSIQQWFDKKHQQLQALCLQQSITMRYLEHSYQVFARITRM